ncbi:MAG: hypothetical protein PHU49_06210 [Syntrophorhabdaceae bacterium]|nr:hypothetical protein [Syntrophorhabdaceae bacterium]MDD5243594.1 hypothetical protein [Syntrophorhabdaceae bacterium]
MGRKTKNARKIKIKRTTSHAEREPVWLVEYYNRAFTLFHRDYAQRLEPAESVHPIRGRFWQYVPEGFYGQSKSIELLQTYLKVLEREIVSVFGSHSVAYWLHTYRRLSPGPIGKDRRPQSIGLTRAAFEAAFQKYGLIQLCNSIGDSEEVGIAKVLNGLLLAKGFKPERECVENSHQLVLTDFTSQNLAELYIAERLAYEIWRTGAMLRIVGKGVSIVVSGPPSYVNDDRTPELNYLVMHHDDRDHESDSSSIGVCYNKVEKGKGAVFLPIYNLTGIESTTFDPFVSRYMNKQVTVVGGTYNFIWIPFNLRSYRQAHLPFAQAFEKKNRVSLDIVLLTVAALSAWAFEKWANEYRYFLKLWQRAYMGPDRIDDIKQVIAHYIPRAAQILNIDCGDISPDDVDRGFSFWDLMSNPSRTVMDMVYSGPHQIFLPCGKTQRFIDYAWILRRLYDLFVGVSIPDQNFKGDALELAIGRDSSLLPKKRCQEKEGTSRQIDFAAKVGAYLVIAECKAVGRSIAYDRGKPEAIKYRQTNVVERVLAEADEKAQWLAKHPVGTNYDISQYKGIVPVGVSPFVEWIPSLDPHFWLQDGIPRVMTPYEFTDLLSKNDVVDRAYNRIMIR